jgi:dihydrofolate reductase
MRKIIVTEYVTADGVMQDPGGAEKGGHGGWSRPYFNEEAGQYKFDEIFRVEALLLGRVTYQGFAAAWPNYKDEAGFADRMNGMPKYVVSNTLTSADWNNSTILRGDVVEAVKKLKQADGQPLLVAGSAQLVHTLRQHNLVDEYRLMVHPVVVGGGKRLFQDAPETTPLKLLSSQSLKTGIIILTYAPAEAAAA